MRSSSNDTIAAIATARGGGVGIVRISGAKAEAIVSALVRPWPKRAQTHKLEYGRVVNPQSGEIIDEVFACVMRAPRSYTGEEVAEVHGHGGQVVLERVLALVIAQGARMAKPGEFTRRAFLSGRIDLTQAEAVAELIAARSERSARSARAQQDGALSGRVDTERRQIVGALAELDGALDFPDEQLDAAPEIAIGKRLAGVGERLFALADTFRRGRLLTAAPEVVLVGRVNAGKSSLFNRLAKEERALVDEESGTTRDVLETLIEIGGVAMRVCDTAGERFTESDGAGRIEQRGQELGRRRREQADLVIVVLDGKRGVGEEERALWRELEGRPRIAVWNKSDLARANDVGLAPMIETSASAGLGIEALEGAIIEALSALDTDDTLVVTSARHEAGLRDAASCAQQAAEVLASGQPAELAAIDARRALDALGQLTGETVSDEVLDAIFARFCIGK